MIAWLFENPVVPTPPDALSVTGISAYVLFRIGVPETTHF
jgi:hypothetical protein